MNEVFTFDSSNRTFTFSSFSYSITSGSYRLSGNNLIILNSEYNPIKIGLKVEEKKTESDILIFELINPIKSYYFNELWIILNSNEDSLKIYPNTKTAYYKTKGTQLISSFSVVAKPGILTNLKKGSYLSTIKYTIKNKDYNHFIIEPHFDNRYWGQFPFDNDTIRILDNRKIFWVKERKIFKKSSSNE